jgi:hypothetical protein
MGNSSWVGSEMNAHTAAYQLRSAVLDLIEAEKFTNAPTCIDHIHKAKGMIYKAADSLCIELICHNDPTM